MSSPDQIRYSEHDPRLSERVSQLEAEVAGLGRSSNNAEIALIRELMKDAPVGFVLLNTDFRYSVVNKRLAEMNGVAEASHLGRTVDEIVPNLAPQVRRVFDEVIATGKPLLDVEFTGETAREPGVLKYWSVSWYPVHAGDRPVLGVGAVVTEITAQKRALEALRTNQQHLEIAEAAGIGSWEWDVRTREFHCSMEYGPLYGLPSSKIRPSYRRWLRMLHPDDRDRVQREIRRALDGLNEFKSEFRVVWPDGTVHWLLGTARVFRDSGGSATRVLGVNIEITERKHAEQAVRDSEQRFRKMADDAPVMICASGPDQQATFFNRGWLSFTGRSLEEQLGDGWIRAVHPDDRDRALAQISESFRERRYCSVEYRLRRADGEYRWLLCSGAPHYEQDGRFTGYIASAIDITDLRRAHEDELARQKLESVGAIAGGIAHDFNNLLGCIMAETELLELDLSKESTAMQGIGRIKLITARAAAIVCQLLGFSADENTEFRALDLSAIVDEMVELMRVSISKRANLRLGLSRNLAAVHANPTQIWQVVLNLLTNASNALGDRGGTITVVTRATRILSHSYGEGKSEIPEGDYVGLEVSDTGGGMTEEIRARIFEPFFSTKVSGRGLGLAVVQRIVRAQGGAIRVASTPGEGSRFEVLLPAIPQPPAQTGALAPRSSISRDTDAVGTVLIVEDEASLRLPVSKLLRKRGYSVLEAEDGDAAIEIFRARAREIGVVLLDLTLPGGSGPRVLSKLGRFQPKVKVILTTAYSEEKARTELGGMPSWGFIRKPYQFGDLVNLLQRAFVE